MTTKTEPTKLSNQILPLIPTEALVQVGLPNGWVCAKGNEKGGPAKASQVFGKDLDKILSELNEVLVA